MRNKIIFSLVFLFVLSLDLIGQVGIRFYDGSLNAILSIAKDEKKNVFIDTYADWCQPCKRMEKKFKDKDVSLFFNEHFVNYRVNMQDPIKANQLRKRYDIVFLPTMLIVDPNGVIKYQVDRELTTSELLNMAQKSLDPSSYHISESTAVRRNTNQSVVTAAPSPYPIKNSPPTPPKKLEEEKTAKKKSNSTATTSKATNRAKVLDGYETVDDSSEKILTVLAAGGVPPEILLQESYLRLEFMDGSHKQTAKEYLSTQENWDTEINRKFILDFVNNASSPEYDFIISNKDKFNDQFGTKAVNKTLEIITYRALHNAVPRPSLEESIELYTKLGGDEPKKQAYNYYVSRLISEDKVGEVLSIGDKYLVTTPSDHEMQYNIARFLTYRDNRSATNLQRARKLMEQDCKLYPNSLLYLDLLGKIYTELGEEKKAKDTYLRAIQVAKQQGVDVKIYENKI